MDILHKVTWMDEDTKNAAVAKAHALVAHVAYPDELTNNTKLEEFYKSLEMDENEYMLNALSLNHFKTEYAIRELYEPVNKTDWLTHATPAMTNAFYSALENSIRMSILEKINLFRILIKNVSLNCRIPRWNTSRSIFVRQSAKLYELWCHR